MEASWGVLSRSRMVFRRSSEGLGTVWGPFSIIKRRCIIILSHCRSIFSSYHLIVLSSRLFIVLSHDLSIMNQYHSIIVLSYHYLILSYLITLSYCRVVVSPSHIIIVLSSYHVVVSCYPHIIALSHDRQRAGKKEE